MAAVIIQFVPIIIFSPSIKMSVVRVVNFRITPYSDVVAAALNSMTEEEIYHLFDHQTQPDVLTAALLAIYKLESQLHTTLKEGGKVSGNGSGGGGGWSLNSSSNDGWVLSQIRNQCTAQTLEVAGPILESLSTVYLRDQLLFGENINELVLYPNVFVMIIDRMYAGHVYAWTANRVTNVIGIRSSLYQLLSQNCGLKQPNIGPIFLNAIHAWAVANINNVDKDLDKREHYLRVIQPSGRLPEILERCGFISTKKIRNNRDLGWLFDNSTIGSTNLINGLLFRERDYIVGVAVPLLCIPPSYEYTQII